VRAIEEALDRLVQFQPCDLPVLSIYLRTAADDNGKTTFDPFVRKEFAEKLKTLPLKSEERASFEADQEKITAFLANDLRPETNALALFACSGASLFDALQFETPLADHEFYVSNRPQLYTLALIENRYPRCAVVNVDRVQARIFVVGLRGVRTAEEVVGEKTNRTRVGGWSQARYQRHIDNLASQHLKDTAAALEKVVREDEVANIVLIGDDVTAPQFREMLSAEIAAKIIDAVKADIRTPEHEIVELAREALAHHDAESDRDTVTTLLDRYRSRGLALVGRKETHRALEMGQVDELVLSSAVRQQRPAEAETFVRLATETSARITFIEDSELLTEVGGVGALLRYRLDKAS
jgi:peptide chain release factor subunit 1